MLKSILIKIHFPCIAFILGLFFYSIAPVNGCGDDHVFQTDSLDFIPKNHRPVVKQHLQDMFLQIEKELPGILQNTPPLTLLSCGSFVFFNRDGQPSYLHADRGMPEILMSTKEITTSSLIFCAAHRTNLKKKEIKEALKDFRLFIYPEEKGKSRPSDESLLNKLLDGQTTAQLHQLQLKHSELFSEMGDRQEFLITQFTSNLFLPLKKILGFSDDQEANKKNIEAYINDHIDDGEGAVIDHLFMKLRKNETYRAFTPHTIYPVIYTERDPCRACLVSIRDYATEELRKLYPDPGLNIIPIVFSTSIYHEQSFDKSIQHAFRYEYPWIPPDHNSLSKSSSPSQSSSNARQNIIENEEDSQESEQDPEAILLPSPNLYLYHMPLRELWALRSANIQPFQVPLF